MLAARRGHRAREVLEMVQDTRSQQEAGEKRELSQEEFPLHGHCDGGRQECVQTPPIERLQQPVRHLPAVTEHERSPRLLARQSTPRAECPVWHNRGRPTSFQRGRAHKSVAADTEAARRAVALATARQPAKSLADGAKDGWIRSLPRSKPSYPRSCRLRPDALPCVTPFPVCLHASQERLPPEVEIVIVVRQGDAGSVEIGDC